MKKRVLRFLDRAFVERSLPLEISSVNGYLIGNTQIPLTAAEMIRGSVFMEISSALQKEIFLNAIFSNRMIADLILYLALASYFRGNEFYSGRAETLALEFTRTITGNPETLAVFDNMRKMGIRATDYLMAETRDPGGKHEAFQNRFLGSARNTLNRTMMDPSGKKAKKEIAERFRSLDLSDTGLSSEQSAALKKKIIPFMRKTLKGTLPIEIIFREGSVIGNSRYALCRSAVQSGTVRMEISRELATDMLDRRPAFAAELALFLSMNAYFRTSTVLAPHSETLARRFTRVFTGEDPATPHNDLLRDYIENRAAAAERTLQDQERREEVVLDSRENAAETAALPAPSETPEITPPLEDEELFDENRLDEYLPEKEPAPSPKPVRGARLLSSFHRIPLLKKIPAVTVLTFLILTGFVFLDFFGPGVKRTDFAPPHPTIARAAYTDDARFDKKLNEIRMSLAAFKAADRMPDEATVVRTLFPGMLEQKPSGEEIRLLQRLLNLSGHPVALRGPGSLGNETRYFGKRTRAALEALQGNPASRHEELALETGKADAATLAVLVRTVVDSIDGMPLGDRTLSRADHDRKADAEAIVNLQRLLNLSETFALPSGPGMGSLGREVPAYGPKTENAVSALAKAMGIAPDRADGSFDPEQMGEFLKRSALKGLFDLDSPAYDGGGTGSVRVAGASPDGLTPEERERFARIEAKLVKRAKKESGEGEPSPDKTGKEGGPEFRKGNGPVTAAGIVEEDIVDPENGGGSRGPEGAYRPVYSLLESGLDSWVSETGLAELTESVVDFWTFRVDPGIDYSRENPELRDVVQGIYGDEIRASILVPYFRRQEIPPPASLEPLSRKIVMALIDTPLFQCASLPSDTGTFAEAPGAIHFPVNLTPRRPLDLFTRRGAGVIGPRTVLDAAQRWRIAHAPLSEEELARDIPEIVSSKTFRVAA
jgi:peptidoglycan hydrolase-like protein with peptidoglycan-binding domain